MKQHSIQKTQLKSLQDMLAGILATAPAEEDCTDSANEMYADMQNSQESITEYLKEVK